MLVSVLRDTYLLHVDDGLNGIQRVCEQLGLFRPSAVKSLRVEAECSPEEHNTQVINATFPKEAFKNCRYPVGTQSSGMMIRSWGAPSGQRLSLIPPR